MISDIEIKEMNAVIDGNWKKLYQKKHKICN